MARASQKRIQLSKNQQTNKSVGKRGNYQIKNHSSPKTIHKLQNTLTDRGIT